MFMDQTGWPIEQNTRLPLWEIKEFGLHGLRHWSSQSNKLKFYTCSFLDRNSALLRWGNDWLAQLDNVTVWDIRLQCWWPCLPVGQHYKVIMSRHCYESVPVLILPQMLPGCKTPTTNREPRYIFDFYLFIFMFSHICTYAYVGPMTCIYVHMYTNTYTCDV